MLLARAEAYGRAGTPAENGGETGRRTATDEPTLIVTGSSTVATGVSASTGLASRPGVELRHTVRKSGSDVKRFEPTRGEPPGRSPRHRSHTERIPCHPSAPDPHCVDQGPGRDTRSGFGATRRHPIRIVWI